MRAQELSENIGVYIREHMSESEKSAMRMEEYIKHSDLNAGGNNYTRTLQIPKIYDKKTIDTFSEIVDTTYGIFEKVIQNYLEAVSLLKGLRGVNSSSCWLSGGGSNLSNRHFL